MTKQKGGGNLDQQLKSLPGNRKVGEAVVAPVEPQKTLQQVCRGEIENLHGIFVCWFKGLLPKEELEKELMDRITTNFTHIAPNGQFLKGRANLLHNLFEKYGYKELGWVKKELDQAIDKYKNNIL